MIRTTAALAILMASILPAGALSIADEMTCEQAIAHYQAKGVIHVMANQRFAVPIKVGPSIRDAVGVSCPDENQFPRPYSVRTRDAWRCVIAVRC